VALIGIFFSENLPCDDLSRIARGAFSSIQSDFVQIRCLESANCIKLSRRRNRLLHPQRLTAGGRNCPSSRHPLIAACAGSREPAASMQLTEKAKKSVTILAQEYFIR